MKYISAILFIAFFIGCASRDVSQNLQDDSRTILIKNEECATCEDLTLIAPKKRVEISDLVKIPQDVTYYSKEIDNNRTIYEIQNEYEENYFAIWNVDKPTDELEEVKWPFHSYSFGKSYGENFQLLEKDFFDNMLESANFNQYATVNERAITLKETNIRAFPTLRPLLRDPSQAGEGFPFDYLQNSTIHANKPIFISHYSKDREWAYMFSSFASGWIKSDEFVILNKEHTDIWQKAKQVSIVKENEPIYTPDGEFLFKSKIGMMFALISEDDTNYTVLTISSYKGSEPLFIKSKISKTVAAKNRLNLGGNNLAAIISEVSKTNYGWGGMYEQRDCSSMLRDMYAPFGIWLPRNSYKQSKVGRVINLENLSDEEKIELIKKEGVAFETLLYKKGHIVLYVGTYNDEVIVFHNTWGIKTKKDGFQGRVVIGKPIFSTLKLGEELEEYDQESGMLKNLISMNIVTQ